MVIADDDVRYDESSLRRVVEGLEHAELVRPQNVFTTWPCTGGTPVARCSTEPSRVTIPEPSVSVEPCFMDMGGYDGDVLFENLELTRTVGCAGGRVVDLPGVFVGRVPSMSGTSARSDFARPATTWPSRGACWSSWHVFPWRCARRCGPGCAPRGS